VFPNPSASLKLESNNVFADDAKFIIYMQEGIFLGFVDKNKHPIDHPKFYLFFGARQSGMVKGIFYLGKHDHKFKSGIFVIEYNNHEPVLIMKWKRLYVSLVVKIIDPNYVIQGTKRVNEHIKLAYQNVLDGIPYRAKTRQDLT